MRITSPMLLFLALAVSTAPQAHALDVLPGTEKNFLIHAGARSLDQNDWAPLDRQGVFGIELDFKPSDWPVGFLVGLVASSDKRSETVISSGIPITAEFEGAISELDAGIRRYFEVLPGFKLFVDAGACIFSTEVTIGSQWTTSQTTSDSSFGVFYGGGAALQLSFVSLGVNARMMNGDKATLFGANMKTDYTQFTLFLGMNF